ncbi:(R)-mandelonitrile lyase [Duganella aceris]|uniref:Cupin domain-containing protein n=1 Tax=Duganella aceris TaxID=2703883 RepID=A0ABX0FNS8_9BURK|nr:cupin domain-containing protein [Duganella aceris]NGZ86276.1 cupin domain-containing protein [Duganella aceris]
MKQLSATAALVGGLMSAAAAQEATAPVKVTQAGSQPSAAGPAANFTGTVRVDAPFKGSGAARVGGALVTFEPGARTAWHTHPLGQTLIVTAGAGRVQRWGGPVQEIKPGDTVWIPPNVKHWHGAAPTTAMSHIAIAENLDGKVVEWLEKVSDLQYLSGS